MMRLYDAIQDRIDAVYDRIEQLETEIGQVRRNLTAFREGLQSSGQISRILDHIDRLYRKMSCAERRNCAGSSSSGLRYSRKNRKTEGS